jgi:parallel beta-helix repeat protein
MKDSIIFTFSGILIMALPALVCANSAPVVSNVTAGQRTDVSKLVDIHYDLADADGNTCTVWVEVSDDGGSRWSVRAVSFSGAVGEGIAAGAGKHIIWDCGFDLAGVYGANYKVRVTADDVQTPLDMVLIPSGEFDMGDHHDGTPWSLPIHAVYVDPFYMNRYEVTNQQYCDYLNSAYSQSLIEVRDGGVVYAVPGGSDAYCNTHEYDPESRIYFNGSTFTVPPGKEDHPMVEVSWCGAVAYCDFYGYRLPTEAEWEYAGRGGEKNPYYRYPFGDIEHGSKANYWETGDPYETGPWPWTTPVGYYDGGQTPPGSDMANGYGLYDIAGNVWEWCNDWHSSTYYSSSPYYNPQGPAGGTNRVLRGGCWASCSTPCRLAFRPCGPPDIRSNCGGFRVVADSNFGRADSGPFTIANRDIWYVDNDAANDPGPNNPDISDPNEDGSAEHPFDNIQEAIDITVDGDTVIVAAGTYNEVIDFIGKAITLRSSDGADVTTIDAAGLNASVVKCVSGEGLDAVLDGFTLTGGTGTLFALYGGDLYPCGGGMFIIGGASPSVTNCTLSGNYAYAGGGMCNYESSPMVTNCVFIGNSAEEYGGGMYNHDSETMVTNCTFSGNVADANGGGMYVSDSNATLTNCILWGNTASGGNEIALSNSSTIDVSYCDVKGQEGGIYNDGSLMVWADNIEADPCFVEPGKWVDVNDPNIVVEPNDPNAVWVDGDYHLKSEGWRWDAIANPPRWGYDYVTSRCIDAGNPGSPLREELLTIPEDPPNDFGQNLRINMGAYGGTAKASLPPYDWALLGDLTNDGIVDFEDFAYQAEDWRQSQSEQPGDLNRNGLIDFADLFLLTENWLKTTSWHE